MSGKVKIFVRTPHISAQNAAEIRPITVENDRVSLLHVKEAPSGVASMARLYYCTNRNHSVEMLCRIFNVFLIACFLPVSSRLCWSGLHLFVQTVTLAIIGVPAFI